MDDLFSGFGPARYSNSVELRQRLGLPKRVFEVMTLCRNEGEKVLMTLQKNPKFSRSEIYKLLSPLPNEALLFLMAKTNQETGRKAISLYFTQLKSICLSIGGEELKALGLVPGPLYKTILGDLLEARINGKVLTREDELAYVKKHFESQGERTEIVSSIIQQISIMALPLLLGVILHEVAHGWVANKLGDPTARLSGRLTLNPLAHIDPFGSILIPGILILSHSPFLFGYAKPVPVNFQKSQES